MRKEAIEILKQIIGEARAARVEQKVPAHYQKTCSTDAFNKNVAYFKKKKKMPTNQAVAASYSALKAACGVKGDKKMTPKEIVAKG